MAFLCYLKSYMQINLNHIHIMTNVIKFRIVDALHLPIPRYDTNDQLSNGKTGNYRTASILYKTQPIFKQTN